MKTFRVFFVISDPADNSPSLNLVTTTSLFTELIFCESVDSPHKSRSSSSFQKADCLLKLIQVNTDNSNEIEQKFEPYWAAQNHLGENKNFVCRAGGKITETNQHFFLKVFSLLRRFVEKYWRKNP